MWPWWCNTASVSAASVVLHSLGDPCFKRQKNKQKENNRTTLCFQGTVISILTMIRWSTHEKDAGKESHDEAHRDSACTQTSVQSAGDGFHRGYRCSYKQICNSQAQRLMNIYVKYTELNENEPLSHFKSGEVIQSVSLLLSLSVHLVIYKFTL